MASKKGTQKRSGNQKRSAGQERSQRDTQETRTASGRGEGEAGREDRERQGREGLEQQRSGGGTQTGGMRAGEQGRSGRDEKWESASERSRGAERDEQPGLQRGQQRGAWREDQRTGGRADEGMGQGGGWQGEEGRYGRGEERAASRGQERRLRRGESGARQSGGMMRRSPFQDMERMFGPLGQLMGSPFLQRGWSGLEQLWPSTDVYMEDDALVVKADLPGMRKDDVEVSIENGELVVSGERRHESEVDERNVYRSERAYGAFYRRVPLPEGAEPEACQARFQDGVLEVKVPVRHEEGRERRRRIDIR